MLKQKIYFFVFVFVFLGGVTFTATKGFALTLDFEGQSFETRTLLKDTGYGGFIWDDNIVAVENSYYKNTYGNTIDFPSNDIAVANGYGTSLVSISRNEPFDFIGAYFSAFAGNDQMVSSSSTTITLKGYNGATLVGSSTFILSPEFSFLEVNFDSITRVELQASDDERWWVMDDFEYRLPNAVVPEPQSIGMFLLFLGGLPFVRRRR